MVANIFANLLGGLVDKEKAVHEIIQNALEDALEELNEGKHEEDKLDHNQVFIMIKPSDKDMNFKLYIYSINPTPKPIREISLKEILGEDQ